MRVRLVATVLASMLMASWPVLGAEKYREIEVLNGGVIRGQVTWEGEVPKEASTEVPVAAAQQAPCRCRKVSLDRIRLDEKTRGLAGTIVFIEKISAGKKMPSPGIDLLTGKEALLDQVNCRYTPDRMVVAPGTQLAITSSDNTPHNVNARMGVEQLFNLQFANKGTRLKDERTSVGNKPGVISLGCNAGHPWMSGYIHVVEHPYYTVTDAEGRFELKDVPPGKYKLVAWHPSWQPRVIRDSTGKVTDVQYGPPVEVSKDVTLEAGATATVEFTFSADLARTKRR